MLNAGITPIVREYGSLGCSGDLAPLAALRARRDGRGRGARRRRRARRRPPTALAAAGIAPLELREKEGLALINGTDGMLGMLLLALHDLRDAARHRRRRRRDERRGACSAPTPCSPPTCRRCARSPGRRPRRANLRALLADSPIMASHRGPECTRVQDAYSLRCAPQVHGAARDTVDARRDRRRPRAGRRRSTTRSSPLDGRVESNGNFHGAPVGVRARLPRDRGRRRRVASPSGAPTGSSTRRAATACRRSSPHDPGVDSGLMIAQYTAGRRSSPSSSGSRCRRRVDSIPSQRDAGGPRLDGLGAPPASCAARSTGSPGCSRSRCSPPPARSTCARRCSPAPATGAVRDRAAHRASPGPAPTATSPPRSSAVGRSRRRLARRRARRSVADSADQHDSLTTCIARRREARWQARRPVRAAPRHHAAPPGAGRPRRRCACCMNNLDPEVAERPDDLVVYGGTGKAARDWAGLRRDRAHPRPRSSDDETMLVQSGRPVGVFRTHEWAPRVLIANSNLVGDWATWPEFRRLEALGPDHVRPDDRRLVDLHRHPGHPAGHLRDVRRGRREAVRRHPRRHAHAHRRLRRHGRRAAARGHHERRRRA